MTAAYYNDPSYTFGTASRKYDEVPADYDANRLHWRFEVAWDDTYVYYSESDGTTEAVRAYDCYWNRGRQTFVDRDGSGLTRMNPGRLTIRLSNHDGKYDPFNSSSPLYPNVAPGKYMRLGVRVSSSDAYTWRFAGVVEDVTPVYEHGTGEKYVEITCIDAWGFLQEAPVYLPASVDAYTSTIVQDILYAVDYPMIWGSSALNDVQYLPFFWAGGKDARTVLFDVAETQDARLWIEGDGKLWYRARTSAQNLVASVTESDVLRNIRVDVPWINKWNYARVMSKNASLSSGVFIIQATGERIVNIVNEYSIASGATITITGKYSMSSISGANIVNAFGVEGFEFLFGMYFTNPLAVGTPSEKPMIRWTFRTATGGGGSDVSGWVELVDFKDGGDGFEAKLRNNHSGTVYSTEIYLRAECVFEIINGEVFFAADQSGGGAKKIVDVSTPYLVNSAPFTVAVVQDIADDYMTHILASSKLPSITFDAQPDLQFMEILDRFNFVSASKGISSDFRVGYIQEKWLSPTGQAVQTVIQTEPYFVA